MKRVFSPKLILKHVGYYLDTDDGVSAIYLRNQPSIQGANPFRVHILL